MWSERTRRRSRGEWLLPIEEVKRASRKVGEEVLPHYIASATGMQFRRLERFTISCSRASPRSSGKTRAGTKRPGRGCGGSPPGRAAILAPCGLEAPASWCAGHTLRAGLRYFGTLPLRPSENCSRRAGGCRHAGRAPASSGRRGPGCPKLTNEVQHLVKVLSWENVMARSPLKSGVRLPAYKPRGVQVRQDAPNPRNQARGEVAGVPSLEQCPQALGFDVDPSTVTYHVPCDNPHLRNVDRAKQGAMGAEV